jgi:hypothetical protein
VRFADRSPRRLASALMLACVIAGCTGLGSKSEPGGEKAHGLSKQRLMLSEGYSLLYEDASLLDLGQLVLYTKAESEAVHEVISAIAKFGGGLKKDLERVARDYPGVRIDLDPLPEMEKRKRLAIGKARVLYFAPVIGHGGREYERGMLIAFSNVTNHERYLCQVMAEEEPDAGLKKFLLDTKKSYDGLYERAVSLLEKEYFKDPDGKSRD